MGNDYTPKPILSAWDLGQNVHGQPLKLIRHEVGGKTCWRIERGQADQRDDSTYIDGLSPENIRAISRVINSEKV